MRWSEAPLCLERLLQPRRAWPGGILLRIPVHLTSLGPVVAAPSPSGAPHCLQGPDFQKNPGRIIRRMWLVGRLVFFFFSFFYFQEFL